MFCALHSDAPQKQAIAPVAARRYARRHQWQFDRGKNRGGSMTVHLWWPAVAKLQAASVPIAHAAAPWDRQTDGQREGRIALFQNAP